jgi:hypothetical protein
MIASGVLDCRREGLPGACRWLCMAGAAAPVSSHAPDPSPPCLTPHPWALGSDASRNWCAMLLPLPLPWHKGPHPPAQSVCSHGRASLWAAIVGWGPAGAQSVKGPRPVKLYQVQSTGGGGVKGGRGSAAAAGGVEADCHTGCLSLQRSDFYDACGTRWFQVHQAQLACSCSSCSSQHWWCTTGGCS